MADPATLGTIAIAGSAASAGIGAFGSLFGGQAKANQYNYQAGIADLNAQVAKQNKDYALATGEVEAQESGMKTRFTIGAEKAGQGASGLDVNSGSPAAVRESQQEIGTYDESLIRSNAARKAYGFDVEAMQDTAQGQLYRTAADTSKTTGEIGAISSILGGVASVSSKWLQGSSVGMFGGKGNSGFPFDFGLDPG